MAKLVARPLTTAALRVRIQTSLKNHKWATLQRSGKQTQIRQQTNLKRFKKAIWQSVTTQITACFRRNRFYSSVLAVGITPDQPIPKKADEKTVLRIRAILVQIRIRWSVPRIRIQLQLRLLLFSSVTFKMATKNYLGYFAYSFWSEIYFLFRSH